MSGWDDRDIEPFVPVAQHEALKADYRALEEKSIANTLNNASLLSKYMKENDRLKDELDAIKAGVRGVATRLDAIYDKGGEFIYGGEAGDLADSLTPTRTPKEQTK